VSRKPQGWNAVVNLGSADSFQKITLPADKAERERVVAKWFWASLSTSQSPDLRIHRLDPLPENDHDFKLATDRGDRFLQLTEFAPLSGPYTEASDKLNVGTTADRLTATVCKKACHYSPSGTRVILLIYATHYAFQPLDDVFELVEDGLRLHPTIFEQVFFIFPIHPTGSGLRLMYPTTAQRLSQSAIDSMRKKWFANSDLTKEAWISTSDS
jgi:hypothetical protein